MKLINTVHIGCNWLQLNKLTLNQLKTNYKVFQRAKHENKDIKLCINNVPIQQVDNPNCLGVLNQISHIR